MALESGASLGFSGQLSIYKELSKSGIVALVLISVLGGYLIGQPSEEKLSLLRLAFTLFGVLFLASGSSALNQLQEMDMDAAMARTANRPLPSGRMTSMQASIFVAAAITAGIALLLFVDWKTAALGCAAVIFYNGLYTLWWKKHWSHAAIPGAIPGAIPVLIGYAAASGRVLSPGGLYLFFVLFFWQMPHFWVLALKYREDYEKGGVPTLPVTHGPGVTVHQIVIWCLAYVGLAFIAPFFLKVRSIYLIPALLMSAKVLWELRAFALQPESRKWLHFFLWINFSLIAYLGAAALDLWSIYLIPYWIR